MKGAVAAGHPLTAQAGARTLEAGGNAVDACVAAALVAWVTESPLTGPGAGGFMLVHRARDRMDALLDFFVAVPGQGASGIEPAAMEVVDVPFKGEATTQAFRVGAASCAVPGSVAGLAEAHRLFGSLPWPVLVEPAIELVRSGVELTEAQAVLHELLDCVLRLGAQGRRIYGEERRLVQGERFTMPDLAETLELLSAEGAGVFYRGELAQRVCTAVQTGGGVLTEDDLASYHVIRRRPVRVPYRSHGFISNPPPSSGGVLIAFALRLLDRLGVGGPPGSAGAVARLAEVAGETVRARSGSFTAELYRGGLRKRLLGEANVEATARALLARGRTDRLLEAAGLPSTTHVSVLDAWGNAASLSSSTGCGSGVVVPGTGIHVNNMLGEADLNPPGRVARPGHRLTSMMAPSILLRDGQPRLVLGSAGSERLRGAITQVVVNVVDHGLGLREAIDRPRVHLDGARLHHEVGVADAATDWLEELGYELVRWREPNLYFGGVSAVAVRGDGRLEAGGDPRRGGGEVVVE